MHSSRMHTAHFSGHLSCMHNHLPHTHPLPQLPPPFLAYPVCHACPFTISPCTPPLPCIHPSTTHDPPTCLPAIHAPPCHAHPLPHIPLSCIPSLQTQSPTHASCHACPSLPCTPPPAMHSPCHTWPCHVISLPYTPHPVNRMTDRRVQTYYLPATLFVGDKNI